MPDEAAVRASWVWCRLEENLRTSYFGSWGNGTPFFEMALQLEKAFHLKMEMLLQMQAWYDSTQMRKQAKKIKIEPYVSA